MSCCGLPRYCVLFFFFFNDTATTEIYTLSLHDALPIFMAGLQQFTGCGHAHGFHPGGWRHADFRLDRKSTRLNSSHLVISYAVFCLKKKTATPRTGVTLIPPTRSDSWTQTGLPGSCTH